ncbi:MAG TPA: hypothetical protein VFA52_02415 [Candidatus Paceibacterota bacterium]|nr:hypothetical protein [Candidatus Paceibacterota bacterium]
MRKHGKLYRFFDHLEDHIRSALSHHPFVYTFVGGVGIVLFWRGVWIIADEIPIIQNGWVSLLVSIIILLGSGLFVSFFVGDNILISGLRRQHKLIEKTEEEIEIDLQAEVEAEEHIKKIEKSLEELKNIVSKGTKSGPSL